MVHSSRRPVGESPIEHPLEHKAAEPSYEKLGLGLKEEAEGRN